MKLFLIISSFLLITSCKTQNTSTKLPSFLIGKWIRVNENDSIKTYETWKKDFTGVGLSLKNKDTTFFEQMKITTIKDNLFLEVSGVNETSTLFKFTKQTDSSFTCENSENEFPKKIKYYIENKQLKAIVSNTGFKIDFVFDKIN